MRLGLFADAPEGFSPRNVYADCQTVVVIGTALPKGFAKVGSRLVYHCCNEFSMTEIDRISLRLAGELERRFGCAAVPMPGDSPYEYWDAVRSEGRGLFSMKHAAVQAGFGTLGKNMLLLSAMMGSMLNLGSVLIGISLPSDPQAESVCLVNCRKCVGSLSRGRHPKRHGRPEAMQGVHLWQNGARI